MTLAGIEPTTFRFVAQHLNHCATAVPLSLLISENASERQFGFNTQSESQHIMARGFYFDKNISA